MYRIKIDTAKRSRPDSEYFREIEESSELRRWCDFLNECAIRAVYRRFGETSQQLKGACLRANISAKNKNRANYDYASIS
jgi:hypothetical protein